MRKIILYPLSVCFGFFLFFIYFCYTLFAPSHTLAATIGVSGNYGPSSIYSGLVGWWTMDGKNMLQNVVDSSGNGNTGYMIGFTSTSSAVVPGKVGQGLRFDGTNSYVDVGNVSALDGATTASWSFWTKMTPISGRFMISKYDSNFGVSSWGIQVVNPSLGIGNRDIQFVFGPGGTAYAYTNTQILSTSTWIHIAFVYDGSQSSNTTKLKLYVNGASTSLTSGGTFPSSLPTAARTVKIGAESYGAGARYFLPGVMDDVRIYNRVLSASEVRQIYDVSGNKYAVSPPVTATSSCASGLSCGLVGYWTFDGKDTNWTTGTTLDKSGNGNNGLLANIATTTGSMLGKIGQALKFNGSTSYVNAGNTTSLTNLGPLTYSAWINPAGLGSGTFGGSIIVSKAQRLLQLSPAKQPTLPITLAMFMSSNTVNGQPYCDNIAIATNKWQHVVATWNGVLPFTGKFYINGVACNTGTGNLGSGAVNSDAANSFYIGSDFSRGNGYFQGGIDDVRVYNRVLSDSEVRQLFNTGNTKYAVSPSITATSSCASGLSCGLIGYWTFDGKNMLQNVADVSGNGNTGYMIGFTSTSTAVVPGKIGQGLDLSKSNTTNYIKLASNPINNMTSANTECMWLMTYDVTRVVSSISQTALNLYTDANNTLRIGNEEVAPSGRIFVSYRAGSTDYGMETNTAQLFNNRWTHMCTVFNGSALTIYANGTAMTSSANTYTRGTTNQIGEKNTTDGSSWFGRIDDVRIYNRALSANEVRQLYMAGK